MDIPGMPSAKRARKSSPTSTVPSFIPASCLREVTPPRKDSTNESEDVPPVTPVNGVAASKVSDTLAGQPSKSPRTQSSPYTPRAGGYNALKSFNGQVYTGMAVGGSHIWNYDQGIWKETKEEPDLWKIDFETTKRRAKNAPEGSGAPVGIEYHWLVVAHQYVRKTDANTYETHLVGSKYKLAHKPADATSWSIPTVKAQRDREVELLEDAKRRVQGLPPVLATERIKVEKKERGQRKLDSLFARSPAGVKRKAIDDGNDGNDDGGRGAGDESNKENVSL